jgi:Family of unknown function (DUF6941)
MRLTTAMLADAAQVQGGKLFVLGGGISTISAATFPVVHRSIAVALIAEIEPGERHRDLDLKIELMDEDGKSLGVEAKGNLRVGAPAALPPGALSIVPIVTPFHNVSIPEPKGYVFVVSLEGEELGRIRFRALQTV